MDNIKILNYMAEYIIQTLNELQEMTHLSPFNEGELLAYIDCLEILSKWNGFSSFGIDNIEEAYLRI